ncbi:MAG: tetratricopeptide repeat protein [Gammaproteobacteria bacterium]|nr:MAG: tetratricopeptide repeat protein [Gammaproteobacteria bacterium]
MSKISILIWLIQLALIIHVLKTGRNRYWVLIMLFLPLIGGIAYLVVEILPGLSGSITGQRAVRNVRKTLNPGADLRHHEAAWEQSPNVDNGRRYAEALLDSGKTAEAEEIVNGALKGLFVTEPTLLLIKARIEFDQDRPAEAVESLETLQENNPDFRNAEGHLLYARALEANGQTDKAIREYSAVSGYFPGVEARYHLAMCLKITGNTQASKDELESILNDAKLAPPHFLKSQKTWLDAVKHELN